jgi:5-methylcytosine-specific restriction endonuclease McrA
MPKLGFLGLSRLAKPLTSEEGNRILARDHWKCQYCGLDGMSSFENSLIMTVDFVVPRARADKKDPHNLVAACRPCNTIKSHRVFKNIEEARQYIAGRRAVLHKEWEQRMAKLAAKAVAAAK